MDRQSTKNLVEYTYMNASFDEINELTSSNVNFTDYDFSISLKHLLIDRFDLMEMLKKGMITVEQIFIIFKNDKAKIDTLFDTIIEYAMDELFDQKQELQLDNLINDVYATFFWRFVETSDSSDLKNCDIICSKILQKVKDDGYTMLPVDLDNIFDIYDETVGEWEDWQQDDYFESFVHNTAPMIQKYIDWLMGCNIKITMTSALTKFSKYLIKGCQGHDISDIMKKIRKNIKQNKITVV